MAPTSTFVWPNTDATRALNKMFHKRACSFKNEKILILKSCIPFIKCITKAREDNAENRDIMKPMYKLLEYSQKCLKNLEIESSSR